MLKLDEVPQENLPLHSNFPSEENLEIEKVFRIDVDLIQNHEPAPSPANH